MREIVLPANLCVSSFFSLALSLSHSLAPSLISCVMATNEPESCELLPRDRQAIAQAALVALLEADSFTTVQEEEDSIRKYIETAISHQVICCEFSEGLFWLAHEKCTHFC